VKLKYFAIFTAISLLSLGIATACSRPSATTSSTDVTAENKAKPGAGKGGSTSVGGSLAKQLQGKPVVVDVYASWCPACENIAPTIVQLKTKYADKIHFVVLDVSDKSSIRAAEAKAKELGLSEFLGSSKTQTGSLAIIDPATGNILVQHRNNPDLAAYTKVLDVAIAK
jgi:thiol-disulfide isomerase/thioredoxin